MFTQLLKKIFIVAIFLSFANCQIAFAANWNIPVDWSKVQKISSKSDLAKYLENKKRNGQNIIPVILTNGLKISAEEFLDLCPSSLVNQKIVYNDGQNMRIIYETTEYPGTKVANAYLSGNTSKLSQEELKLYNVAVGIINEAKKKNNLQSQEMYIYSTILNRTMYYSTGKFDNQPRHCTAIGALIDGRANCQGYSDAFYMLCRMMNWNVNRMIGTIKANGGAHMWNTITFNTEKANERTYCVDVTLGDDSIQYGYTTGEKKLHSYIYFNAPIEIMQVTHSWNWDLAPTIQSSVDSNYAYGFFDNLVRMNNPADALKLLAKKLVKENNRWFSVMTMFDEKYSAMSKNNIAFSTFDKELHALGYNKKYGTDYALHVRNYGKYLFFTAHRNDI